MSALAMRAGLWLNRIGAASRRACGWPGLVGLALLAGAAADVAHIAAVPEPADDGPVTRAVVPRRPASAPMLASVVLDEASLPGLQRALAARATAAGMAWTAADYRLLPATETLPPAYEVHSTLKGRYPAIRRFVADGLTASPPAALREFTLTRPGVDSGDVEAHVTLAFFLDPAASPAFVPAPEPTAMPEVRP